MKPEEICPCCCYIYYISAFSSYMLCNSGGRINVCTPQTWIENYWQNGGKKKRVMLGVELFVRNMVVAVWCCKDVCFFFFLSDRESPQSWCRMLFFYQSNPISFYYVNVSGCSILLNFTHQMQKHLLINVSTVCCWVLSIRSGTAGPLRTVMIWMRPRMKTSSTPLC